MESTWYLFAGQTLENTKIDERAHALHITETEFAKITSHLDRKKRIQEQLDREEQVRKYLEQGSRSMTEKWPNSLENMRKTKEQERQRLIEQKKDDRMQKFLAMRKEQEIIRKQYVEQVKNRMFLTTGPARAVTSALITADVEHEREKQIEMNRMIKEHEEDEKRKYAVKVKENAIMEVLENKEKKKNVREKAMEHRKELEKQIECLKRQALEEKQKRIELEAIDNVEAYKEMKKIEELEQQKVAAHKRDLYLEKLKNLREIEIRKKQLAKEEEELDEVIEIYKEAKHNIECLKKQKIQEKRAAELARLEKLGKFLGDKRKEEEEEENRRIQVAVAERDATEAATRKKKKEDAERMRKTRIEDNERAVLKEKMEKQKEAEIRKWEMVNRYKADEVVRQYEMEKKREEWRKIIAYRRELDEQVKEREEDLERIREIDDAFIKTNQDQDEKFFKYAQEVLKLAKQKRRNTYPIEKVISNYKKKIKRNGNHEQGRRSRCKGREEN